MLGGVPSRTLVVVVACLAVAAAQSVPPRSDYDHDVVVDFYGGVRLLWSINGTQIHVRVEGKTQGYVGLGFADELWGMHSADIIAGSVNDTGHVHVSDYHAMWWSNSCAETKEENGDDYGVCDDNKVGGTIDITDIAGEVIEEDGDKWTVLAWSRLLDTGDDKDRKIVPEGETRMIFARGKSVVNNPNTVLSFHHARERGRFIVDFAAGTATPVIKDVVLRYFHGVLQVLTWGVIIPVMALLARHYKHIGHKWFLLHRGLNSTAVVLSLVAAILAYASVHPLYHWATIHAVFGLLITILMLGMPPLGFLADKWWSAERTSRPLFPDVLHQVMGYLLILIAFVNIYFGFKFFKAEPYVSTLFTIWLVVFGIFAVYKEVDRFRNKPKAH